jgi:hypothetical protein
MIINFPGGQTVDVQFDDVAHSYVIAHKLADGGFTDFRPTHGITAPLEVVPKPFLTPWGAKEGVEAVVQEFTSHPEFVETLEQFWIDKKAMDDNERTPEGKPVMSTYKFKKNYPWFSKSKAAYKEKSKDGKEIGSWLHSAIEQFYRTGRKEIPQLDEATQPIWDGFIMFDNFFKPKADADGLEFLVYSLMFGYSGQGDFRGTMNGKHCIGDWKTTNRSSANPDGISVEYFFQVGGLAQAEFERTGKWVDDLFIANFDKKGEEPRVIWASEFGMSPQDCARAYLSCFNNYHTIKDWDYKYSKR